WPRLRGRRRSPAPAVRRPRGAATRARRRTAWCRYASLLPPGAVLPGRPRPRGDAPVAGPSAIVGAGVRLRKHEHVAVGILEPELAARHVRRMPDRAG